MTLRDLPGWPPVWANTYTGSERFPRGEMGTLVEVEAGATDSVLIVTTEYEGRHVAGVLPVRTALRDRVVAVLRAHRGRALAEVADAQIGER